MYEEFLRLGQAVERAFARLAVARGYAVRVAPRRADCNEHWDLALRRDDALAELRVDVKGRKRLQRGGELQDEWHWVELHGVRPHDAGWLYGGRAELITFETQRDFVLVERERLMDIVEALVPPSSPHVGYAPSAKYRLYSRADRADLLTLIETTHLRAAAWAVWPKHE